MTLESKNISKIAAKISPRKIEEIKTYIKSAFKPFAESYYDDLYYDRWFYLNMIFKNEYFYKEKPCNAFYDYYVNIGKTESDAVLFALLDLNCLLEEVLAEYNGTFLIKRSKIIIYPKGILSSYMLISRQNENE